MITKYLVYVEKAPDTLYSITIPDFPGVFSSSPTIDGIAANVQEAIALYFEDEPELAIPAPTGIEVLNADADYKNGFWLLVGIDFSFLDLKVRRINVTIPENILAKIDGETRRRKISRSAFLSEAALAAIDRK